MPKKTKNPDVTKALAAARRGACVTAARHFDRALRIDLHGKNALSADRKPVGLVILKHCTKPAKVARQIKFYAGLR